MSKGYSVPPTLSKKVNRKKTSTQTRILSPLIKKTSQCKFTINHVIQWCRSTSVTMTDACQKEKKTRPNPLLDFHDMTSPSPHWLNTSNGWGLPGDLIDQLYLVNDFTGISVASLSKYGHVHIWLITSSRRLCPNCHQQALFFGRRQANECVSADSVLFNWQVSEHWSSWLMCIYITGRCVHHWRCDWYWM